jgi:8-oxo-dGTP pyrophosphatase MutT (NUDIX family)
MTNSASNSSTQRTRRVPLFDPQAVPISAILSDAPAVDLSRLHEQAIRERFSREAIWTPEVTDESRLALASAGAKQRFGSDQLTSAAVLVPLVRSESGLNVLLTQRTDHLNDHAGQISFPGGRAEESDADALATALREAEEEVGLSSSFVEYIGDLPDYLTITGYRVTPVVGIVHAEATYKPDPFEVADIFQVPLHFLMNPANHQLREWEGPGGRRRFYAMPYEQRFIWGATAGMLRNLYHFLNV